MKHGYSSPFVKLVIYEIQDVIQSSTIGDKYVPEGEVQDNVSWNTPDET